MIRHCNHAAILMYHRVLPDNCPADWLFPSLVVDVDSFARQMRWLCREFHVTTVGDLLNGAVRSDKPRAAVTFDDGYSDNARYAAPILEAAGVRGTFFVTTGFIGTEQRLWFDVAARVRATTDSGVPSGSFAERMSYWKSIPTAERRRLLDRLTNSTDWLAPQRDRAMTVADILRLKEAGHEVGVHTRTHPILTRTEPQDLESEIAGSLADLRRWGSEPRGIAYPNGDYSEDVVAAVKSAGLQYGLSTSLGWFSGDGNVFAIPRIDVNMARLKGWHQDPVEGLKAELAWLRIRRR